MCNLKKILALVLAFACAFTMFAGAASYSDQADIKASTAVDMLSSLGVIQGYDDGSFKPNTTVTRAQMAKMIFTIMNGGNDNANAYASLPTAFTDLPTAAWAQGYVRYLQNTGIIAGKSATKFAPNDTVTGLEAAKMVLVAAGYNAQKAGLTGAAWAQNTMKYGQLNNLFEDVDTDLNAALPRQYAAQILYNALDMERVVWSNDIEDFKPATDVDDDKTIGGKYMDLVKTDAAQLLSVEKTSGKDTYEITLGKAVKYGDGTNTKAKFDKVPTDVADMIGLNVKVLVKAKANGDTNVYGVYADDDSKVLATGTVGTLDTVKNESKKFKVDGTEYKAEKALADVPVIYPNKESVPAAIDTLGEVITTKDTYPAYSIKAIDLNGNNKADLVVAVPTEVKEVTYVGSSAATIGGKSYKFDDADIYDGIKKDDWAVVVSGDFTSSGDPIISKATVVSGKVTGVKTGSPDEIKIDGNWYKKSTSVTTSPSVDDEVAAAVVGNYVYNIDTTGASSKNILFISDNKAAENNLGKDWTVEARAYFTDGSNKKIVVDKLNGQDVTSGITVSKLQNCLFTYATDKDGNYELKEIAASAGAASSLNGATLVKNMAGYDKYNTTATSYTSAADVAHGITAGPTAYQNKRLNSTLIADDAVLFVSANDEIKVISGKTARDWADTVKVTNKGFLTKESNGIDYVKVAALTTSDSKVANADGDKLYAYVTEDSFETKKNGDTVTKFHAIVGNTTEAVDLYEDGTSHAGTAAGSVIIYTVDGDEIDVKTVIAAGTKADTVNSTVFANGAYAIKGFDGKKKGDMSLVDKDGAVINVTLDEDCVFIGVDDAKNVGTVSEIGAVPTSADKDEFDRYDLNAYVVFNSENKVIAVVYDTVNNELNVTNVKTASTVAAKNVTLTSLSAKAIEGASETVTVAASPATAKPGTTVTLTATVSNTGIADKDTTVVVKGDKIGNVTIVVKKGQTSGTATFTMPTSDVEFTFVSATAK